MRRLPIYLVLDTSGSMSGEPIEAVKNGVQMLVSTLRQDPYALETAYLSIITFSSEARQLGPLTELPSFQVPPLSASGVTQFGAGLSLLAQRINAEVAKTTQEAKGDWKPIVFIMTDGEPTDDWERGLEEFRQVRAGLVVACAIGTDVDNFVLKQVTESVVQLDSADSGSIKAFFKWVSASVSVGSKRVDGGQNEVASLGDLPPPPPEVNLV